MSLWPVPAVLAALAATAAWALPFLTLAPHRLASGAPVGLPAGVAGWRVPLLLGLIALGALPGRRAAGAGAAAAAAALAALLWTAGDEAARLAAQAPAAARIGLGAGFWAAAGLAALALPDLLRRAAPAGWPRRLAWGAMLALLTTACAHLGALSLAREAASRQDALLAALLRHIALVAGALLPTVLIGLPLGLLAHRRRRWRGPVFGTLNLVQTIPAIALFGLLMAPLAALAQYLPPLGRLGIGGIGPAPAITALALYALLPIVRNTAAGLDAVPPPVRDAARGMGMTRAQMLRRVEAPLAFPVFLAGLRITIVQTIGLAVLAALIGAGGLGVPIFEGLYADALDLVLLGLIPVVLLARAADALFALLARAAGR